MIARADLGLLADDLTGACDLAAAFAAGMGPLVVTEAADDGDVLNTQSRGLPAEESRALLRRIGQRLAGKPIIFKKIDSTLRGPAGAELEGMLEGLGFRRVILAPAIPRIGKTTRGGMLYENGVPVTQTAYAADPSSPARSAGIAAILAETGQVGCHIADAETDDDLRRLVDDTLADGEPVLFAGSLGLADALVRHVEPAAGADGHAPVARQIALVSGSLYERTQRQIQQAVAGGAVLQEIDAVAVPGAGEFRRSDAPPVILRLGGPSVRSSMADDTDFLRAVTQAAAWVQAAGVNGLGIVGGETAYHLFQCLGISRLRVSGRMAEVIAYGTLLDGALAGCPFAMKGGSVGPDDALELMIRYLRTGKGDP